MMGEECNVAGLARTLFHVTLRENLAFILDEGLVPSLGDRSRAAGEKSPAVFLFTSREVLEAGLSSWLGEAFDEDAELIVIKCRYAGRAFSQAVEWEIAVSEPIPVTSIVNVVDEYGDAIDLTGPSSVRPR